MWPDMFQSRQVSLVIFLDWSHFWGIEFPGSMQAGIFGTPNRQPITTLMRNRLTTDGCALRALRLKIEKFLHRILRK